MSRRRPLLLLPALLGLPACGSPTPSGPPPPRVIAVEGGDLLCVAVSRDGTRVAAGSSNDRLRIWDVATGTLVDEARGHRRGITAVAFSPEGARLATAGPDRTVRLWTAGPLEERTAITGPERPVDRLAWAESGARVVALSQAGELHAWDPDGGDVLTKRPGPAQRGVQALALDRDGGRAAWAADGGTLRLWDAETGAKLAGLRVDRLGFVAAVALAGDVLATGARDDGGVALWDLAGGRLVARHASPSPPRALAFDPAGARLARADADGRLVLVDATSGLELAATSLGDEAPRRIAFAPDGAFVAAAGPGPRLVLWDVSSVAPVGLERGSPLDAPILRREGEEAVAPIDPDALDLAALTLPGYDPPELRPDPAPLGPAAFPAAVRALDGRRVTARGYPLAAEVERGLVHGFLLSRFPPGCCFGKVPVPDEWIEVTLAQGAPELDPTRPVDVTGLMTVGELLDERGSVQSLYRLQGERVEPVR